jgi:hypothetical protein
MPHPVPSAIRVTFSGVANRTDFPTPPCTNCANWNGTYELPYYCGNGLYCVWLLQVPPQCGRAMAVVTVVLNLNPGAGFYWIAQITEGAQLLSGCWGLSGDAAMADGSRLANEALTNDMCNFGSDTADTLSFALCTAPTSVTITTVP